MNELDLKQILDYIDVSHDSVLKKSMKKFVDDLVKELVKNSINNNVEDNLVDIQIGDSAMYTERETFEDCITIALSEDIWLECDYVIQINLLRNDLDERDVGMGAMGDVYDWELESVRLNRCELYAMSPNPIDMLKNADLCELIVKNISVID